MSKGKINCIGCKAYRGDGVCVFGFKTKEQRINGQFNYGPVEMCSKPTTEKNYQKLKRKLLVVVDIPIKPDYSVRVGGQVLERDSDGFNPLELIGLLELAQRDIRDQIEGRSRKPDIIEKVVVKQV